MGAKYTLEDMNKTAESAEEKYIKDCAKILAETLKENITFEDMRYVKNLADPKITLECNGIVDSIEKENTTEEKNVDEGVEIGG